MACTCAPNRHTAPAGPSVAPPAGGALAHGHGHPPPFRALIGFGPFSSAVAGAAARGWSVHCTVGPCPYCPAIIYPPHGQRRQLVLCARGAMLGRGFHAHDAVARTMAGSLATHPALGPPLPCIVFWPQAGEFWGGSSARRRCAWLGSRSLSTQAQPKGWCEAPPLVQWSCSRAFYTILHAF